VIDLHLHTTASDGRCDPPTLVRLAWQAGLRTIAVTDHDTMAGVAAATYAARDFGIRVVAGIEITAVLDDGDVHVLGYFLEPDNRELTAFLEAQRAERVERARAMARRLAGLGKPIDLDALLRPLATRPDWSVGRPAIAQALVTAGHVSTPGAAFQQLIGEGCPAWMPRKGAAPGDVIRTIARAGGVASLAHPGLIGRDAVIEGWAGGGLPAIEVINPSTPRPTPRATSPWRVDSVCRSREAPTTTATIGTAARRSAPSRCQPRSSPRSKPVSRVRPRKPPRRNACGAGLELLPRPTFSIQR
jgi:3',5'-nucleoside bisphosphate phosphatase